MINAFEYTTVPYGDDNRMVRGIIARCGAPNCEAAIPLPVNAQQNTRGTDFEIEYRFISRKLEAKGWRIGKSRTAHRCPRCLNAARMSAIRKSKEAHAVNGNGTNGTTNGKAENAMTEKLSTLRVMGREDRRIIFEKLNEVYVSDKIGYGNGWTDEKVAVDLGVPRAWVKLIRDENFGDEIGNDDIRTKVQEAAAILAQIKSAQPQIEALQKLFLVADKIEKTLAQIATVLK